MVCYVPLCWIHNASKRVSRRTEFTNLRFEELLELQLGAIDISSIEGMQLRKHFRVRKADQIPYQKVIEFEPLGALWGRGGSNPGLLHFGAGY